MSKKSSKYQKKLIDKVWSTDKYYQIAEKGSFDFNHPAMKVLKKLSFSAKDILDFGCGEGTRLNYLAQKKGKRGIGIDVSAKAIALAQKKYPQNTFVIQKGTKLPFPDSSFDLVYSAFVFEHLDDPQESFKEIVRVTKKNGKIVITAPNFGAPNRASPPFKGGRIKKLILGFFGDFFPNSSYLNWQKVTPLVVTNEYQIDFDTTVEPYLLSLIWFARKNGLKIITASSLWEMELSNSGSLQRLLGYLGKKRIYPFTYWGPHLLMVAKKV